MKELQKQLLEGISIEQWELALNKCYIHIKLKLIGRTLSGAHCEQRLGMVAQDFYTGKAIKSLYDGSWEWKYDKYSIDLQLIRIIDSMISEEVRKYKVEVKRNQKVLLMENTQLTLAIEDDYEEEVQDDDTVSKFENALNQACADNNIYKRFVELKRIGHSYENICQELKCTKDFAYQIMETISRRAQKILLSL